MFIGVGYKDRREEGATLWVLDTPGVYVRVTKLFFDIELV